MPDPVISGDMLQVLTNGMLTTGKGMAGNLLPIGKTLLGAFSAIALLWIFFKALIEDDLPALMSSLLGFVFNISLVLFIFATYSTWLEWAFKSSTFIAATAIGGDPNSLMSSAMRIFADTVGNMTNNSTLELKWWDAIKHLATGMIASLIGTIAFGISFLAMGVYFFIYLLSDVLLLIGFVIGPIMIAGFVMPASEFLFTSWIRHVIGAMFYKVVASIVLAILSGITASLSKVALATYKSNGNLIGTDILLSFYSIIISLIVIFVMWQVPGIAAGLVSGSASMSGKFGMPGRGTGIKNLPGINKYFGKK